jgi:hypothetical protein
LVVEHDLKPEDIAAVRISGGAREHRHTSALPKKYPRNAETAELFLQSEQSAPSPKGSSRPVSGLIACALFKAKTIISKGMEFMNTLAQSYKGAFRARPSHLRADAPAWLRPLTTCAAVAFAFAWVPLSIAQSGKNIADLQFMSATASHRRG